MGYGLAAEFLGMELFYLEAGSGAPEPVPPSMVKAVSNKLSIPLIVGGGIRDPEAAKSTAGAGADILVTGTVVEENDDVEFVLREIVSALKGKGRGRPF